MNLHEFRKEYIKDTLSVSDVEKDPLNQFKLWFEDAKNADFIDPNAMVLSTVDELNKPSSRVVLLKEVSKGGFVFFTNYMSRKGDDIKENNNASLLFFWDKLERQVRIEGVIEKITHEESKEYFFSRPKESQIGAWASKQSAVLKSREYLEKRVKDYTEKFGENVEYPEFWGGYRLHPNYLEFWQGRASRLHDRIIYKNEEMKWNIYRLYP